MFVWTGCHRGYGFIIVKERRTQGELGNPLKPKWTRDAAPMDTSIRQSSRLALLQRRRDSPHEDDGAAHAREEARGLAWLE
eukprot:scaffold102967_cov59-Phaeocystis_antarctica.AAC.2